MSDIVGSVANIFTHALLPSNLDWRQQCAAAQQLPLPSVAVLKHDETDVWQHLDTAIRFLEGKAANAELRASGAAGFWEAMGFASSALVPFEVACDRCKT